MLPTTHTTTARRLDVSLCQHALVLLLLTSCTGSALAQPDDAAAPSPEEASTPKTLADARDLLMEGSYEQAMAMYETLASDERHTLEARLGQARCRLQTGEYREAIAALKELDATQSSSWHYLLAELSRRTGAYDEAMNHARLAMQRAKEDTRPRRLLGELLEFLGQREEAIEVYRWFYRRVSEREELPRDAVWITDAAVGLVRYSVLTRSEDLARRIRHALTEMLQVAYGRIDRSYWPARIAAADMLRERYNNDEEDGSMSDYQAALLINEHLPQAYVGIGEVMLAGWVFEEAERNAEKALEINPHCAPAIHLVAKKLLTERRYDEAFETCDRALAINPNDITAFAIRAAARACQFNDEEVRQITQRVTAINPNPGFFYRTLGDALGGIRQYEASERAYLKAIELDPTDANAHTDLGLMYMQWGPEDKARRMLDEANALDPFNERTHFTLELLDQISTFARVETPHFLVKYDEKNDPGLGELMAEYLESIYDAVTGDYGTDIVGKTIIEVFPTHRGFGVRITGKPWIYTIGAATGRVIALASPRDRAHVDPYNFAGVLKHEFTHTVTLEATGNRIPHWFTEALAVSQEEHPRPFPWMQMLAEATRHDRLFTLESISWGFVRPKRRGDRQLAYAQSEWMSEYIVERFGYDAIQSMLERFGRGQTQRVVFKALFDIELEAFDKDFKKWARDHVARWGFDLTPPEDVDTLREEAKTNSEDAKTWGRLARAEYDLDEFERALDAANRAIELDENEPNGLDIYVTLVALLVRDESDKQARRTYEEHAMPIAQRLLKVDPNGWIGPRFRGDVALRRRDYDLAGEMYRRLQRLCPMDPSSWRGLAGIHLVRDEPDLALPQLLEAARLDPADGDSAAAVGRIYRRRGRLHDARYWLKQALYVDPFGVEAHRTLGDIHMQMGDTEAALQRYRVLTKLEPDNASHFELAAMAAHKMGDKAQAEALARRAVQLDPESTARSLLP